MLRQTAFALGLVTLACAPTSTSTDTAADDQALHAAMESVNQGVTAHDDSAIAAVYAEDAVMMPPGVPKVVGRANIRAFWATLWPLNATVAITPERFVVAGDWAWGEGTWTWSAVTPAGPQEDHGKYLDVWHRVDGNWFLTRDIWNSDLTPPAPPVATRN
jgi:ketosteroid isomerase-like protein